MFVTFEVRECLLLLRLFVRMCKSPLLMVVSVYNWHDRYD